MNHRLLRMRQLVLLAGVSAIVLGAAFAAGPTTFTSDDFNNWNLRRPLWTFTDPIGDVSVRMNGVNTVGHIPHRREKEFLKKLAFVAGQRNRLFWDLPAEEYFQFCKVVYEIPEERYAADRARLVEMADIGEWLKVPQRKLSAGQRKRCVLVAALLHDPRVIFLDEPTNALDLVNARKLREVIRAKAKDGNHAIILTSHNMADIGEVCDRIVVINAGRIAFDGDLSSLYQRFATRKQIRIRFNGQWSGDRLALLGEWTLVNPQEAVLEVDPAETARVAAHICSSFPIQDITITEAPIERIIESIYAQRQK